MKITLNTEADVLYIELSDKPGHRTQAVGDGLVSVDLAEDGTVIGIELISPSLYVDNLDRLDYLIDNERSYVTVEEMATMHGVTVNTIHRILRIDQEKPQEKRRIPGAHKVGDGNRGVWRIPRSTAKSWKRDDRGRKSPA